MTPKMSEESIFFTRNRTHLKDILPNTLFVCSTLRDPFADPVVEHDERKRQLAAIIVRRGHDAHVRDVWMVQEVALQLRGRNLEPAYLDELLYAPGPAECESPSRADQTIIGQDAP